MKELPAEQTTWYGDFVAGYGYDMLNLPDTQMRRYDQLIAYCTERCGPQQPVSEAIRQTLKYHYLVLDQVSAVLHERFTDEELTGLASRCKSAGGIIAMHERLTEAIEALGDGSWDGDFWDDVDEKILELLHKLLSLDPIERDALCDMLLRLQANESLTVGQLRANLGAYVKTLTASHRSR